ncbi:Brp/Blh family beta-carotene 15,15'-dioxygenase [Lichenicola sp.]|uniref:Brp/Blh family beta-carotene 15,15'-dioxygenase n=1 Tax=Lichenicola sp. TaxID=2804529 RepID=UPI003AFF9E2F
MNRGGGLLIGPASAPAPATTLTPPILVMLLAASVAGTALLPPGPQILTALLVIIALGVPHGALDGELAREALRPGFGRIWFLVFSTPYLLLAGLVLISWQVAPTATLVAFFAASVWHFGSEETSSPSTVEILARGGLPIGMAVLAHPVATASLFATISHTTMAQPPAWMWFGSLAWLGYAGLWAGRCAAAGTGNRLILPGVLACVFLALPPLTAFAIYFVCIHAPAHTRAVITDRMRGRRVHDVRSAVLLSLPVTALTLILGAALWPLYSGPPDQRLLSLTIQGLAALTLPHMLFEAWLTRRVRIPRPGHLAPR